MHQDVPAPSAANMICRRSRVAGFESCRLPGTSTAYSSPLYSPVSEVLVTLLHGRGSIVEPRA